MISRFRYWMFALFVIVTSGCGIGDYQKNMDAQRKRVADFDEINQLLGPPIETPTMTVVKKEGGKEDAAAWPFEIFFRLPKNYASAAKEKSPYNAPFPCFRFDAEEGDTHVFIAAQAGGPKFTASDFRNALRKAISEYHTKAHPKLTLSLATFGVDKTKYLTKELKQLDPYIEEASPRVRYDYIHYLDGGPKQPAQNVYEVYLHQATDKHVGIVFHRSTKTSEKGHDGESFAKIRDVSLSTLDISDEAGGKRMSFKKSK